MLKTRTNGSITLLSEKVFFHILSEVFRPLCVPTRGRLTSEQLRSHDVYIGRGCEKLGLSRSEWCDLFKISKTQPRAAALQQFAVHARAHLAHKIHLLAGRRLLCHCRRIRIAMGMS